MSRKRAASPSHIDDFDDEFYENNCLNGSKNQSSSLPVQRNAANARERARMRVLSSAFCRLKTKLPWVPADTKLSKLDTLRLATMYIQQLRSSLATTTETLHFDTNSTNGQRQTSLVWPFTFQQPLQLAQQQPPPLPPLQSLPERQSPSHHHQSNETQTQELLESNRLPEQHANAWYDHRDTTCVTNHYNVHFYSTFSNASSNSSFEHEKYQPKSGISNQNSSNLSNEHG